jgi:acyl-CoA thioester hydrolase
MQDKTTPTRRARYAHVSTHPTRWGDNDVYGHVNNVVYYAFFDTAVTQHLIERGVLDIAAGAIVGFVVETRCTFFSPIAFPDVVHAGLRVTHLGNTSVRYEIALFRNDEDVASAVGEFVHVYVERATNRPVRIPDAVREVLGSLVA